ncbi:MAG: carbon storage regulator CsrA [Thermodesulfobacteriota bacterium]
MLVLSRKKGEAVLIGDDISIVVLEVKEHQVKLGISAPQGRFIHREEVYQRIQTKKRADSTGSAADILTDESDAERS